ncbi:hypothetical protein [Halogeometricum limi]|uniref:Uncharacterized protein n=1 Tax=Halogeometricum limi TaxID=555875 RepID=A0A1I6H996_9EURY|nr:hypothetical protein [Halogeometricum limi]SFR51083.1 hypothetical protein SAMN04488124_1949 [Halogeometricum limi]
MTRYLTTRRPPHAVATAVAAALDEWAIGFVGAGVSGDETSPLCVRSALGA